MKNYETITEIKHNSRGRVCLASTPEFDHPVIVKERKYANPAVYRQLSQIENIHIPKLYSCETDGDTTVIMEEYVDGEQLDTYVRERHASDSEITALVLQVCECMGELHRQTPPIIHRDLKPENILVTGDAVIKIIDFDASRNFDEGSIKDTRLLGTEGYAPPEQFGYAQTDARSDIYAIGVILYELIFGQSFPLNHANLSRKELYPLDGRSKLARRLVPAIKKCTQFQPDARYADTAQLAQALRRAQNPARKKGIAAAAALVCVACFAAGGIFLYGKSNSGTDTLVFSDQAPSMPDNTPTYIADSFDSETGKSIPMVVYYLQSDPSQPPFRFSFRHSDGKSVQSVTLTDTTNDTTHIITGENFRYDADTGLLYIPGDYLQHLKPDREYTLCCFFEDLRWQVQLYPLSDESKLEYSGCALLSPGYCEFDKGKPHDYVAASFNAFGRKITGVSLDEQGEQPLDPRFYTISEDGALLTVSADFFAQYESGDVFYIYVAFEEDARFNDNAAHNIYIEIF